MNLEKVKAIITDVYETTYEDNTFWVNYKVGDNIGYEIVTGDKAKDLKEGNIFEVKKKLHISVCSEVLQDLIHDCSSSDNEMLFVEEDDNIYDMTEEGSFIIQDEVIELDNKYPSLKLSDYITFGEDEALITVYGGISTLFEF